MHKEINTVDYDKTRQGWGSHGNTSSISMMTLIKTVPVSLYSVSIAAAFCIKRLYLQSAVPHPVL